MKFDGIAAFAAIAAAGSVSGAARNLNVSKSVVSERLKELERALGAHLVQRTTRRLTITAEGGAFLERANRILREAADARAEIAERRGRVAGALRVSAPVSFGTLHLGRILYPFLQAHPDIELTLELEDRFVDVAAGGYDAVIRHGTIADDRVIVKRLAASKRYLVASPAYLKNHGVPASVTDLDRHRAILYAYRDADWRFKSRGGTVVVRPARQLRVNNGLIMRDAALAGLGIALLPTWLVSSQIAAGDLSVLDVGTVADAADIFVAYPASRGSSAKMRAFVTALKAGIGSPPAWDVVADSRATALRSSRSSRP
jgi:DNA-binding transcriptional LysR family regulator